MNTTQTIKSRITADDIRAGRARFVTRKGYVMAEGAPSGTQLRLPMPRKEKAA